MEKGPKGQGIWDAGERRKEKGEGGREKGEEGNMGDQAKNEET